MNICLVSDSWMVWQFPEGMGFVEGELQVHSSSKCLKMFNENLWIFLHFYLINFFLSYWIFLRFYLFKFFFFLWTAETENSISLFSCWFSIPPLAPSINHFQHGFERTGHWLCSSPFEWGKKKILSFKQKQTFHEPICFANW